MLWPFSKIAARPARGTIETIYGTIVAQARLAAFYQTFGVPDTVNARFDMVLLHLWLVLRRLRSVGGSAPLAQGLIDRFCSDMDNNLRELGVGDLTVPKRMLQFGEAFFGRSRAYDEALQQGDDALQAAFARNIYAGRDDGQPGMLAHYARRAIACLDAIGADSLLAGDWHFAPPNDAERA